jgi:predicted DNA-binding transcriptional regulator AlpA
LLLAPTALQVADGANYPLKDSAVMNNPSPTGEQSTFAKSLRPNQAAEFLGIAPATLWRWLNERPDFPRSRKIGPRTTVFDLAELAQWRDAQQSR